MTTTFEGEKVLLTIEPNIHTYIIHTFPNARFGLNPGRFGDGRHDRVRPRDDGFRGLAFDLRRGHRGHINDDPRVGLEVFQGERVDVGFHGDGLIGREFAVVYPVFEAIRRVADGGTRPS